MEEYIERLLESSLDIGLKEFEFWEMTVGEIIRAIDSWNRNERRLAQEKASYDYIQATLIVKGISITLGSKEEFPTIQQAYPGLFDDKKKEQEEKIAQAKMELSALRFRQFAQSHNRKYKNEEVPNKDDE